MRFKQPTGRKTSLIREMTSNTAMFKEEQGTQFEQSTERRGGQGRIRLALRVCQVAGILLNVVR